MEHRYLFSREDLLERPAWAAALRVRCVQCAVLLSQFCALMHHLGWDGGQEMHKMLLLLCVVIPLLSPLLLRRLLHRRGMPSRQGRCC